jgi:Ca2+-binding EF-hand superfamily protein
LDTDNDGKVTEEEFLAPLREAFQRMDEDRDGALDDGERPRRDR